MSLMSKLVEDFRGTDHAENAQAVLEFATRHKVWHLSLLNLALGNSVEINRITGKSPQFWFCAGGDASSSSSY